MILDDNTYERVPVTYMKDAVQRYIESRIHPGSFLSALISNDLKETVRCADDYNASNIIDWVGWFYNYAPSDCWGSRENFDSWLNVDFEGEGEYD